MPADVKYVNKYENSQRRDSNDENNVQATRSVIKAKKTKPILRLLIISFCSCLCFTFQYNWIFIKFSWFFLFCSSFVRSGRFAFSAFLILIAISNDHVWERKKYTGQKSVTNQNNVVGIKLITKLRWGTPQGVNRTKQKIDIIKLNINS